MTGPSLAFTASLRICLMVQALSLDRASDGGSVWLRTIDVRARVGQPSGSGA